MEKAIIKIKKIKELAERGIGGEKIAAQKLLKELCQKYKINEYNLTDNDAKERIFTYNTSEERSIFIGTVEKLFGDISLFGKQKYNKDSKLIKLKKICLNLTEADFIDLTEAYEFYRKKWKKQVELLLFAYLSKHQLYDKSNTQVRETDFNNEDDKQIFSFMHFGINDDDVNLQKKLNEPAKALSQSTLF